MKQVIIYQIPEGNVAVCIPSGEISIDEVLAKNCPEGAIIVNELSLPTGANAQFFDAWELNGTSINVNIEKAKAIRLDQYNTAAYSEAEKRQINTIMGIPNVPDNETFKANLIAGKNLIETATTTTQLLAIKNP